MSVNELSQAVTQVAVTWADSAVSGVNVLDIPRMMTLPAEVPYAEGVDYVTRLDYRHEFDGGNVCIKIPSALAPANVFIRRISIRRLTNAAQKGLGAALYPNGTSLDSEFVRDVLNISGNTLLLSDNSVKDVLGVEPATGTPSRTYPGITLMAGEYARLEVWNATAGAVGPSTIEAIYRMGRSQMDTGKP